MKAAAISQYGRNPEFEDIPDIEADRDNYNIVSWDLEPGDAWLFHAMAQAAIPWPTEDGAATPFATPATKWYTICGPASASRWFTTNWCRVSRWIPIATPS